MTLVTFTKPHGPYRPGDTLFADAETLAELRKAGVIEADEPPPTMSAANARSPR
jgi:hypothetical protein